MKQGEFFFIIYKKWILKFKSKDFIKIFFGYNTLTEILNFLYGHSPIT